MEIPTRAVTNALALAAAVELMTTGDVHAENGAVALTRQHPELRRQTSHEQGHRQLQEVRRLAPRFSSVWRPNRLARNLRLASIPRQASGRSRGRHLLDRTTGPLAGLGGFVRRGCASRLRGRDPPARRPARRASRARSIDIDDDDDEFLDRVVQRLPVIGPVLIILSGFVFWSRERVP